METISLTSLSREHLKIAKVTPSGRSSETVHGGHDHVLRQTLIALLSGHTLDEHDNPGEATLQVLQGSVRLRTQDASYDAAVGDHLTIPRSRHSLDALEDSVVLLSVAKLVE